MSEYTVYDPGKKRRKSTTLASLRADLKAAWIGIEQKEKRIAELEDKLRRLKCEWCAKNHPRFVDDALHTYHNVLNEYRGCGAEEI